MVTRDIVTGKLVVRLSREEFLRIYTRWQQKPETREMFAKYAAERKKRVQKILADIEAQKKK